MERDYKYGVYRPRTQREQTLYYINKCLFNGYGIEIHAGNYKDYYDYDEYAHADSNQDIQDLSKEYGETFEEIEAGKDDEAVLAIMKKGNGKYKKLSKEHIAEGKE